MERFFEDYTVGEVVEFGDYLVTEKEIISFAESYDPQPFHTDPIAAKQSNFGGIISSGWMTAAIVMRLFCDHFIPQQSAMGSPGIDSLQWMLPVRPNDRLHARATILSTVQSKSKPDRGVIGLRQEAINQDGEVVLSFDGKAMFKLRNT